MTIAAFPLDSFIGNIGTSPKMVCNVGGLLAWVPHNLCRHSNAFDNAGAWVTAGLGGPATPVITANAVAAPDGSMTAESIVLPAVSAANNVSIVYQQLASIGSDHTLAVWLKGAVGGENTYLMLGAGATYIRLRCVLTTTWKQFVLSGVAPAGTVSWSLGTDLRDTSQTSTPAGTVHAWGAQCNRGATLLPYLPNSSAVARCGVAIGYDPVTKLCNGALSEPTATNLVLRSCEFDNAAWPKAQVTVTADATAAPDGTMTADKLIETSVNNVFYVVQSIAATTGAWSVFAKAAERSFIMLYDETSAKGDTFNLSTGAVAAVGGIPTTGGGLAQNYGNGWWRCSIPITACTNVRIHLSTGASHGYTGTAGQGVYIWGAQAEAATSIPTSFIPTFTATVTRTYDSYTLVPASLNYSNTAGTWWAEVWLNNAAVPKRIIGYQSGNTPISTNASTSFICFCASGNVSTPAGPSIAGGVRKVAAAWQANDVATTQQGSAPNTATFNPAEFLATPTLVLLGDQGGDPVNGWLRKVTYRQRRISNAEMQTETA